MNQDIDQMLSFEVKKEIADRYFGFRKLIEEDLREFDNQVANSLLRLEQKIGFDLVRLYILLRDEQLIHRFFKEAGLKEPLFFDPYFLESPTIRKRLFKGLMAHGLTRHSRFTNMIMDIYDSLARNIDEYNKNLEELSEERETIAEEIKLFYRNNDLGTIMGFLRGLGGAGPYKAGSMEGGLVPETGETLEQKMRVKPPPPVEKLLPVLPHIKTARKMKHRLKPIIDRAYELQGHPEMRDLVR